MNVSRIMAGILCLLLATIGCRDNNEIHGKNGAAVQQRARDVSQTREVDRSREAIAQFRSRVQSLTSMLDAKEDELRKLAQELYKEATADSAANIYETLSTVYIEAVTNISFDIEHDVKGGEKEHDRLYARLRNQWHINEWAAFTVFLRNPEKLEGWDVLLAVILKEREAAVAAESTMQGLDVNDRRQLTRYWRLEHFKREMSIKEDSQSRLIKHFYHSMRHRLTPEQRANVVSRIKAILGRLPAEMECDLPTN